MANLTDAAVWSDNEVYLIDEKDLVEGAKTGARFNDLGVANRPHQQLANRTAYLKDLVNTFSERFSLEQGFIDLDAPELSSQGYLHLPFKNSNTEDHLVFALQWWIKPVVGVAVQTGDYFTMAIPVSRPYVPYRSVTRAAFAFCYPVYSVEESNTFIAQMNWLPNISTADVVSLSFYAVSTTGPIDLSIIRAAVFHGGVIGTNW
jgi:hypothetical protein